MQVLGNFDVRYLKFDIRILADGTIDYSSISCVTQSMLDDIDWCDVVVFGREWLPQGLTILDVAKQKKKKIIYDLDDNLLIIPDWNPAGKIYNQKQVQDFVYKYLGKTDLITCTHNDLAEYFTKFAPCKVLKNFIYEPFFRHDDKIITKEVGDVVVGWAGSGTHLNDLLEIREVVERILKEYKNVYFAFMGSCPKEIKNIHPKRIFAIPGDSSTLRYFRILKAMNLDIAIAPLTEVGFNRYKSNLKALEYSACGYPVIASKVYEYKKYITHGVDGMLATKFIDWYSMLKKLIADTELRKTLITNSQAKLKKYCDLVENCQDWVNLYSDFIGVPREKVVNNYSEEEFTELLKQDIHKHAWFGPKADEHKAKDFVNSIARGDNSIIFDTFKKSGFKY